MMQYNSWLYLFPFLGSSLLLYYIFPLKYRWTILLFSSIIFYLLGSRYLILFLLFSTLTIYLATLEMEHRNLEFQKMKSTLEKTERKTQKKLLEKKNKIILFLICLINFGILFFTKYFNFAGENLNHLFSQFNLSAQIPVLHLLLPLGISFYTLSAVSYVTDVARGMCTAEHNYFRLLLFLIFFPVITEGPISRYGQLGIQLKEEHAFNYNTFCFGCQLLLWGLFQKVVLSDRVNMYVHHIFSNSSNYCGLPVILAILLYTFQIYMDFAGCINIARGSAALFGIQLEENFRRPFFSTSVNEFWRRWHITLGSWFKDYIFYPISLSHPFQKLSQNCRKHMNRYYATVVPGLFALFAVWLGNGIWHGAEWKYICYGLYYYMIMTLGILLEPLFVYILSFSHISRDMVWYHRFQIVRTFLLVNIGMLIFRAKDLSTAFSMFCSMFRSYHFKTPFFQWIFKVGGLRKLDLILIIMSIVALIFIGLHQEKGLRMRETISKLRLPFRWCIYLASVISIIAIGAYGPGYGIIDFIYAQF